MKIVVLDYSGHLPQADLSKKLCAKDFNVLHLYCNDYVTGTADFSYKPNENQQIKFMGVSTNIHLNRYKVTQRLRHEVIIAKSFYEIIDDFSPDIVVLSNLPLIATTILTKKLSFAKIPYIYWWQDVYSDAIVGELKSKFRLPGFALILNLFFTMEKRALKGAKAVVAISDNFEKKYLEWKLDPSKLTIHPNWSAPEDFAGIMVKASPTLMPYFVYAGTLGIKHNPQLLIDFADQMEKDFPEVRLMIISQGLGREYLSLPQNLRGNMILKDFMPLDDLKNHLFHALAVIAILEPSASEYSVPSKVMTYFCAGKAIIAAISPENQVARYIQESNAGYIVSAENASEMTAAATKIICNDVLRKQMELNAKQFANDKFSGERAADLFIKLFHLSMERS